MHIGPSLSNYTLYRRNGGNYGSVWVLIVYCTLLWQHGLPLSGVQRIAAVPEERTRVMVIRHESVGVSGWNWIGKGRDKQGGTGALSSSGCGSPKKIATQARTRTYGTEPRTVGVLSLARRLIICSSRLTGRLGWLHLPVQARPERTRPMAA